MKKQVLSKLLLFGMSLKAFGTMKAFWKFSTGLEKGVFPLTDTYRLDFCTKPKQFSQKGLFFPHEFPFIEHNLSFMFAGFSYSLSYRTPHPQNKDKPPCRLAPGCECVCQDSCHDKIQDRLFFQLSLESSAGISGISGWSSLLHPSGVRFIPSLYAAEAKLVLQEAFLGKTFSLGVIGLGLSDFSLQQAQYKAWHGIECAACFSGKHNRQASFAFSSRADNPLNAIFPVVTAILSNWSVHTACWRIQVNPVWGVKGEVSGFYSGDLLQTRSAYMRSKLVLSYKLAEAIELNVGGEYLSGCWGLTFKFFKRSKAQDFNLNRLPVFTPLSPIKQVGHLAGSSSQTTGSARPFPSNHQGFSNSPFGNDHFTQEVDQLWEKISKPFCRQQQRPDIVFRSFFD